MYRHTCVFVCAALAFPLLASAQARGRDDEVGESDWPMYNHDVRGTRSNGQERTLSPTSVGQLYTEWVFHTPNAVSGTPTVCGGHDHCRRL
jgi:hypothetical protein